MGDKHLAKHDDRLKKAVILRLLAREEPVAGSCLSDQELALLLAGQGDVAQLATYREHLSTCPKCYEAWLLGIRVLQRSRRVPVVPISRYRRLGYLGSALALAASIVIYFNVVKMEQVQMPAPPPFQEMAPDQPVVPATPPAPAPALSTGSAPEMAVRQPPLPSPQSAALPRGKGKITEMQLEPADATKDSVAVALARKAASRPQVEQELGPGGVSQEQKADTAVAVGGRRMLAAPSAAPSPTDRWREKLGEACRLGQSDAEWWAALRREGQELLAASTDDRSLASIRRLVELVPTRDDAQSIGGRCRLIAAELNASGGQSLVVPGESKGLNEKVEYNGEKR